MAVQGERKYSPVLNAAIEAALEHPGEFADWCAKPSNTDVAEFTALMRERHDD